MEYLHYTSISTPLSILINNNSRLEKSAVCHVAIQNYSSNCVNICSIITIIIYKKGYCLLQFKAAINPLWF